MKRELALVALASILAACDPGTVGTVESDSQDEHKITVSTMKNPRLVVGDTATTTDDGGTLVVLSYESPLSLEGVKADPGSVYSAIEVKGCDGPSSGRDLMSVGPNAFTLRLQDGTSVQPEGFGSEMEVKRPALQSMNPPPSGCDRGFVTFQVPRNERPDLIVFEEQFVLKSAIAWKIPASR